MHSVTTTLGRVLCFAAFALCQLELPAHAQESFQRVALGSAPHYEFPLYANHALAGDLSGIEEAIVVFHGLSRNGDDYYAAATALLNELGVDARSTLVIAPNFFDRVDLKKRADLTGLPLWNETDWMAGENSADGPSVSSYAVVDDLMTLLTDRARLPRLRRIVIAGHSGGGQLVDRYAILNAADERIRSTGIDLSYVIANPSSYLYFTPARPAPGGFAAYDTARCAGYNTYRYGLDGLVPYATVRTEQALLARFGKREVAFLWGGDDVDPNHRVLDKSCPAEAQGPNRYERGHNYWRYLHALAGSQVALDHQAFDVTGVGHDQGKMFGSQCGSQLLFGQAKVHTAGAACVTVLPSP